MGSSYHEGTCFIVPLKGSDFAIGVVARTSARKKAVLCYFFGPYSKFPTQVLRAKNAVLVAVVGDLRLIQGQWPTRGDVENWNRNEWPIPLCVRRPPLTTKAWLVHRSDTDIGTVDYEEEVEASCTDGIIRDEVWGAGAAETKLLALLSNP